MKSLLCITPAVRADIERVKKHASENITDLSKLSRGDAAPGGLDPKFTIDIPFDYCATYTEEKQKGDILCRHLSVSVSAAGRVPNHAAMDMLMEEFGFINRSTQVVLWTEKFGDNTQHAINVVEPISGDMSEFKIVE